MSDYQAELFETQWVYVVCENSDDSMTCWVFDDLTNAHKKARKEMKEWYNVMELEPDSDEVCKSDGWDQGDVPASVSIEQEPYPWIRVTRQRVIKE